MTSLVETETPPALYDHCVTVYDAMHKESVIPPDMIPDEDGHVPYRLYEGHLTKLFQELRLSVPYYTSVTRELKRMGCIGQIRRGGGGSPSQWALLCAPSHERYNEMKGGARKSARELRMMGLEQQVRDLTARVNKLEMGA